MRLRSSALPGSAATNQPLLELTRTNGYYKVTAIDSALPFTHNGKPLQAESPIEDGDEVALTDSDLAFRFFPIRSLPAVIEPRPRAHPALHGIRHSCTAPGDQNAGELVAVNRPTLLAMRASLPIVERAASLPEASLPTADRASSAGAPIKIRRLTA